MQYHLNGFRPGDPHVQSRPVAAQDLPAQADVVIVGCGPAGLTLAAQMAGFGDISTVIVDQKPGPLEIGQADGIACRSVEMFEAFGFAERVLREAYWVNETSFWKPDGPGKITRSDRIQDTEDGLSEFPHVILSQARVHDFYLDVMRRGPAGLVPFYNRRFEGLEATPSATLVRFEHHGKNEEIAAKYVIGCDGARSGVRRAIGLELAGDAANKAWGVMDVLVDTDFPDIRLKSVIHSASEGSVLIIPREGGYMVRLYVELDKLSADERVADREISKETLIAAAGRILRPYRFEVKEVAWWSVYEIGQRLAGRFDNGATGQPPTVFIAGDAAHTHSPKAGQGMNVSMADAFNLGWKLASVLRGQSGPALLETYSAERQGVAQELIDFDRELAQMFATKPKADGSAAIDPKVFQQYFQKQGRFTAGTSIRYAGPSMLQGTGAHQALAPGFEIGTRFHSAPVICVADAKPVQLGHMFKADGRWRIVGFAGAQGLDAFCTALARADAPLHRYRPKGADIDAVIDLRGVFQQGHREIDLGKLPAVLRPKKGRYGLTDYEKAFAPDLKSGQDIFALRGIDRSQGCMVILRPDQVVAQILPLDDFAGLSSFFERVMGYQTS